MAHTEGGSHLPKKENTVEPEAAVKKKKDIPIIVPIALAVLAVILALVLFVNGKLNLLDYDDGKLKTEFSGDVNESEDLELNLSGLEQKDAPTMSELDTIDEEGIINILLLGTDERDFSFSEDARADAIMLLSLNTNDYSAKLISIERGTGVPILDGEYEGLYDWITHCFRYGGADLMMREVEECFKVKVDRYVRINLNMLVKVIDVIGGVDVELTALEAWYINTVSRYEDVAPYLNQGYYRAEDSDFEPTNLVEGMNHLHGEAALAYARLRALDSDWHRIERQRTVLQACVDTIGSADLSTLNELCNEILPMVRTNLTKGEIAALMLKAPGFLNVDFGQMTLPAQGTYGAMTGMGERGMFAPDFDVNAKILQEFIYGK